MNTRLVEVAASIIWVPSLPLGCVNINSDIYWFDPDAYKFVRKGDTGFQYSDYKQRAL